MSAYMIKQGGVQWAAGVPNPRSEPGGRQDEPLQPRAVAGIVLESNEITTGNLFWSLKWRYLMIKNDDSSLFV